MRQRLTDIERDLKAVMHFFLTLLLPLYKHNNWFRKLSLHNETFHKRWESWTPFCSHNRSLRSLVLWASLGKSFLGRRKISLKTILISLWNSSVQSVKLLFWKKDLDWLAEMQQLLEQNKNWSECFRNAISFLWWRRLSRLVAGWDFFSSCC